MSNTLLNHKRPSLNDQINRLDTILDGLAEGLNDAVATAVREAVVQATETVLREVLRRPELWQAAASASAATGVVASSVVRRPLWSRAWDGLTSLIAASRRLVVTGAARLRRAVTAIPRVTTSRIVRGAATIATLAILIWRSRRTVPLAMSIGMAVSALAYVATPELSAALQGFYALVLAFLARLALKPRPSPVAKAA